MGYTEQKRELLSYEKVLKFMSEIRTGPKTAKSRHRTIHSTSKQACDEDSGRRRINIIEGTKD